MKPGKIRTCELHFYMEKMHVQQLGAIISPYFAYAIGRSYVQQLRAIISPYFACAIG